MKNKSPTKPAIAQGPTVIYAFVFAVISAVAAVFAFLDTSAASALIVKSVCGVAFILCIGFFVLAKFSRSDAFTE